MKTRSYFLLWSVIILTLPISSCTKEEEPSSACCECLKPATQSGRNTMSMMINGKPWSNCNPKNTNYTTVGVYWDPEHYIFRITGLRLFNESGKKEEMIIEIPYPTSGLYNLKRKDIFGLDFRSAPIFNNASYSTDTSRLFNLFITKYDETNRIISGTFDCTLIRQWGNNVPDSLIITEGRFDTQF